jgi:predicted O-methyltransferase YrrM
VTKPIVISKHKVRGQSVHRASSVLAESPERALWYLGAGTTEYPLYIYLSKQVRDSVILDIGTRNGNSAVALACNPLNEVITYDIEPTYTYGMNKKKNIERRIGDFMLDDTINYNNVSIIVIDVDPHDGAQEPEMIKHLEKVGWSGLLILDDIGWYWPDMEDLWNDIKYTKYDLTDIGHEFGTGLVVIGDKFTVSIVE